MTDAVIEDMSNLVCNTTKGDNHMTSQEVRSTTTLERASPHLTWFPSG